MRGRTPPRGVFFPAARRAARPFILALLAAILPSVSLRGQSPPSAASPGTSPTPAVAPVAEDEVPLRDRYRRVYFYQSEAARLVPPDFRPVALDDLQALLERPVDGAGPAIDRPQLVRAVYVAYLQDDALRSEQSWLDIRYRDDAVGQLDLGPVNLALADGPDLEQGVQQPRLVSRSDGTLRAVVSRDCRIDFGWSLGGRQHADGTRSYEMVIPRCGQSRILIGLPTTRLLRSADGVARLLPSPPPEVTASGAEPPARRWYEIEAGGLSRVHLQVDPAGRQQSETLLPVRQQSIEYRVGSRAVHWTMRLVLDAAPGAPLPPLAIGRGRASEVLWGGVPIGWTETNAQSDGDQAENDSANAQADETVLQFATDTSAAEADRGESVMLTLHGASEMSFGQPLPLPWPRWLNARVVYATPTAETQLRIDPAITLLQAETPAHWSAQPMFPTESGSKIYRWSGPPGDAGPTIRVSGERDALTAAAALRLVVREDVIQGRWETVVTVDQQGPQPLRMQIQRDWRITSVTLPDSGRVLDAAIAEGTDRWIEVWPESEDVREGRIRLQVVGERPMASPTTPRAPGRGWRVPSTWFVRLADSRTTSAAAIIPPPRFRWSGSTALRGSISAADGLSGIIGDMLGPVPSGALLFHLPTGATPPLELEQPLPEFEVDVQLALDADEGEVFETLSVLCHAPAPELNEVRVRSGDAQGRPPLVWSVEAGEASPATGSMAIPVTARRDEASAAEEGESWLISLPAALPGDIRLIGRRRYPLAASRSIDLPSVPQAATQRTSVVIGPRLRLERTRGPVLRLPASGTRDPGVRHLRYDPSEPASITIAVAESDPGVALAWQTDLDYFVSTRSGDDVVGRFQIDPSRPLRITHDPQLHLVRVEIDGRAAADGRVATTTDSVSISSGGVSQTARLHWRRPPLPPGGVGQIFRRWRPPRIDVQGVVLRQRHRVWSAPDTVVLAAGPTTWAAPGAAALAPVAPPWMPDTLSAAEQPIPLSDRNSTLWVLPAEAGWGLATVVALAIFAIGWAVALRAPLAVAVGAGGLLLIAVVWPLWALAIVGFLVAPAIAAGLLAVSTVRRPQRDGTQRGGASGGASSGDGGSVSRLATRSAGLLLLAAVLKIGLPAVLTAQDATVPIAKPAGATGSDPGNASAASTMTTPSPAADDDDEGNFTVLIPVTAAGEMAGTKVYVPESLYSALFRRWRGGEPDGEILLRHAEYRIRIGASIEGRSIEPVRIEARLELETGPVNVPVHLPLPAAAVRDVEIVVAGEAKAIRWFPADDGILLQLPRPGLAQLRVSIVPPNTVNEHGIHRVRMPIPPVADAEVTLDADAPLDLLALEPCLGAIDALAPAGRMFADLGPVAELAFQWRFRRNADVQQSLPLVRRWWVHAALDRTVAECEIEPPGVAMAPDEQFELDVHDPVVPLVVSSGWSLVESTAVDATRHRLVLQSRRLAPGPIRLLWQIPRDATSADNNDGRALSLPSVRPVRTVDLGPTLLAINADPRLQVALAEPATGSPIEVDRFLAGWIGYKGAVQQALTLASGPPRLTIQRTAPQPWRSVERQHLHVTGGRLHLEMSAVLHPGGSGCGPLRLIMPATMDVHRLEMAGQPVTASTRQWNGHQELPLPDPSQGEPLEIVFSGSLPLPSSGRFRPPRVRFSAVPETSGSYLVTRDTEVEVNEIQPSSLTASDASISDKQRLSSRWVPRWSWQLDSSGDPQAPYLPGTYQVRDNPTETDTQQLTTLMWEDGRWSMETVIHIRPLSGRPDFFSVELPAQWTDELQVEPAGSSWSRQPSTDELIHLVQILPVDPAAARHEVRIRGRLASSDTGRVEVPDVRLLGNRPPQRFFAVPRRLTSDPINWLTTGARQQRTVPPPLRDAVPQGDSHAMYEITGRNWSAKLLPATTSAGSARSTVLDIQLFPQADARCLALCRWDLLPSGADQVRMHIPSSVTVHAAWSNGLPARLQRDGSTATVPLNLSRLAQPVVLLVEFADVAADQPVPVPRLLEIPVASTWIARYGEAPASPDFQPVLQQPWSAASAGQRRLALAQSVLSALDGSLERLAERPDNEIAAWLAPWLARVGQLQPSTSAAAAESDAAAESGAADATAPPADAAAEGVADSAAPAAPAQANPTDPQPSDWDQVAQRTEAYVDRALGALEAPPAALAGPPSDLAPSDWHVQWTAHQQGAADSIPAALLAPSRPTRWQAVRPLLAVVVLLAAVLIVAVVGRPLGQLARLPQLWLLLIGAVGLLLAPIPVAVALCLLAVTSPLLRLRPIAAS